MLSPPIIAIRVELEGNRRIGPGKIRLLELIDQTGSIAAAAREMAMSYRRAWLLIDEVKVILGTPAVVTSAGGAGGGGARLTDKGRELIACYRDAEQRAAIGASQLLELVTKKK